MSYITDTNHFFKTKVYSSLVEVAVFPVGWALKEEKSMYFSLPNFGNLLLAALCSPILIPATFATSGLALSLAAVAAVAHGLSLLFAALADYGDAPEEGAGAGADDPRMYIRARV